MLPYFEEISDKSHADLEWRQQALEECDEVMPDESSTSFWKKRLNSKTISGSFKYPNLRKIVDAIFTLPFCNDSVERLFSLLKLIKTSMPNSLKRETLIGLMHTHEGLKASKLHANQAGERLCTFDPHRKEQCIMHLIVRHTNLF